MAAEADNEFVISSTRNPCSYYLSLWGYINKKSWFKAYSDAYKASHGGSTVGGFDELTVASFSRWVIEAMGQPECKAGRRRSGCVTHGQRAYTETELESSLENGAQHGILSIRFWQTLMGDRRYRCWAEKLFTCSSTGPRGESVAIVKGLSSYPFHALRDKATSGGGVSPAFGVDDDGNTSPKKQANKQTKGAVDCWVYIENYEATLTACLKKYEAASGFRVNWEKLQEVFSKASKGNGSKHPECEDVFKEVPWLGKHLMAKDRIFANVFGYQSCCGASDRPDANPTPYEAKLPLA
jgi:hypothetical protein